MKTYKIIQVVNFVFITWLCIYVYKEYDRVTFLLAELNKPFWQSLENESNKQALDSSKSETNKKINSLIFYGSTNTDSLIKTIKENPTMKIVEKGQNPNKIQNYSATQIKIDSLEKVVNELTRLIKSNIAFAPQVQVNITPTEKPKTPQLFSSDISIIFRTRKNSISGKIKQDISNFQYGQLFHFENTLPEYLCAFTDNKGSAIGNEEVKKFLLKKSFWINSIELKEQNSIINCSTEI